MKLFDTLAEMGHEEVVLCSDPSIGYRGILAVHSTKLGPALGGTRFWHYATDEEAITDALRLSRGMTYKNAVAGLNLGGGKSIIIGDNKIKDREKIFRAHGRFVESLGGRYITAEDVGTTTRDMDYVHMETGHVAGLAGKSGDPSPVTAHGVFRAVQASANRRWGSDSLEGRTVSVQGCGSVGSHLAKELNRAGAQLIVSDIDSAKAARVAQATGAKIVEGDAIFSADADIFSPCALGGIINDTTIPKLKVEIVAGAANNQLLEDRHGDELQRRNILYAPDYVANAGGVINVYGEVAGWDEQRAHEKADEIYDTILKVFDIAEAKRIPTYEAADRLAEQRLAEAR
ncbi:MAG TPA: Glu/Leu/Phe/Val dehydrogenase [Gemmatimonadaceae bacterium]|jgi:leucine dehydrogenase|nr:Glu/Leu/Phe/Val dehydrogenase [Gemmatimonadaceae bacterium]